MTCCENVLDNCQVIKACFETLLISGLGADMQDVITITDLLGNSYRIDIESDPSGNAEVDLTSFPEGFFNEFAKIYFIKFDHHVITFEGKTYAKLLLKIENIQSDETEATIKV